MDEHKSHEFIVGEINKALKLVKLGTNYVHYKNKNKVYKPVRFGTLESNDELCVIYEAQYGPGLTFIRPLREWIEKVEWNGKVVSRFNKL